MYERFSEMIEIQQVLLSLATQETTTCLNLGEKLSQVLAERREEGDVVTVQTDYRFTVRQPPATTLYTTLQSVLRPALWMFPAGR